MGPHGTFHFVREKLESNQDGTEQCSGGGVSSGTGISGQPFHLLATDAQSYTCSSARRNKRNKVYDDIMRQWENAASSIVPMPRSSHRRVLGGQALPTRQRGESFSLETSGSGGQASWGNLSDTVSPAVQLAWREQLLRLKLSRLAGVPMTVLLRQQEARGPGGVAATEACRVVAASQSLSAKLMALAVIEGTCSDVSLNASSSLSKAAARPIEGFQGSGGGGGGADCEEAEQQPQPQRRQDNAALRCEGLENKVIVGEPRTGVSDHSCASSASADSMSSSSSSSSRGSSGGRRRTPAPNLPAKPPVRGFHLVDLHAVVRNSVEWRQCLPKVEPCFRVGSNRDGVLLGLVHALGGRLSCSSAQDIHAAVCAARRASPVPAPPPRLLDRHVCRSPALLRASVAAGVQLYEVDSADEWRRIRAARRRQELSDRARSRNETAGATSLRPRPRGLGSASVVVRLAMPFRPTRQSSDGSSPAPAVADFSGAVEASYGARAEDVVEIVQAAMAATVGPESGTGGRNSMTTRSSLSSSISSISSSSSSSSSSSDALPIVGFSVDVGSACWDDALAGHVAVPPPFAQKRSEESSTTPDAATDATGLAPREAVPSASLAESIDAAVAFAVEMAGVAAEVAAAAATKSTTAPAATAIVDGESSGRRREEAPRVVNGRSASELATMTKTTTTAPLCPSTSSSYPFSFRRLHVTGLGGGGARGEPLAALRAALSRHLPPTTATAMTATSSDSNGSGSRVGRVSRSNTPAGRPIVVSADATEHLVAGGVWSTVASIIGRKSVPPTAVDEDFSSPTQSPTTNGVVVDSAGSSHGTACNGAATRYPAGEGVSEGASTRAGASVGGAMYYIDDGCYGSLSGALLRGVQMQPLPLRVKTLPPPRSGDSVTSAAAVVSAGKTSPHLQIDEISVERGQELPCTVWGPTCDGLDCVCRMTPLPDDMKPGRDWLFFPDVGIRGGADATDFNGLKPLDLFYCIRQRGNASSPTPAPALPPSIAPRAVSP